MKIPEYVKEMMSRSKFVFDNPFYAVDPGYTIKIKKFSPYTTISTFQKELDRLVSWVNRQMPEDEFGVPTIVINDVPSQTHHVNQVAIVTIYDPIMQQLEEYIGTTKYLDEVNGR